MPCNVQVSVSEYLGALKKVLESQYAELARLISDLSLAETNAIKEPGMFSASIEGRTHLIRLRAEIAAASTAAANLSLELLTLNRLAAQAQQAGTRIKAPSSRLNTQPKDPGD